MTVTPKQSILQYYRVDRRDISFFRFVLEGADGLAVLTTLDPVTGNVALAVAPGCESDVADLVTSLKAEMLIEPAPPPEEGRPSVENRTGEKLLENRYDTNFLY